MRKSAALEHFGTLADLARVLEISVQAVWQWPELIPPIRANQLRELTGGALRFDPYLYPQGPQRAKALALVPLRLRRKSNGGRNGKPRSQHPASEGST